MKNRWIFPILALVILAVSAAYFSVVLRNNQPSYEGTELTGPASDFQLTDQNGSLVSLSDFRGKVVVLTFMDTKCQDTCPLTAAHFREVYRKLKPAEASQVVFLGVNVNVEESTVGDVLEATNTWRLDEISNWYFLTGTHEVLEPVWKDYGASAAHGPDGNSVIHTPGTFLIDQFGQKRWYISTPFSNEAVDLSLPLSQLLLKQIRGLIL